MSISSFSIISLTFCAAVLDTHLKIDKILNIEVSVCTGKPIGPKANSAGGVSVFFPYEVTSRGSQVFLKRRYTKRGQREL